MTQFQKFYSGVVETNFRMTELSYIALTKWLNLLNVPAYARCVLVSKSTSNLHRKWWVNENVWTETEKAMKHHQGKHLPTQESFSRDFPEVATNAVSETLVVTGTDLVFWWQLISRCRYRSAKWTAPHCKTERSSQSELIWQQEYAGSTQAQACPAGTSGTARRKCSQDERWLKEDLSDCVVPQVRVRRNYWK